MEDKTNKEIDRAEAQLETLKGILLDIDFEAMGLIDTQDNLFEEITPINAALMNLEHKLQTLSVRKKSTLKEYTKVIRILEALSGQKSTDVYIT